MENTDKQKDAMVGFMHRLAAEDVDAANITGEENMAGEPLVTAALPEEDFDEARNIADTFGMKPAGERGDDERTGMPRFAFQPRF
jgi:hypothetical protein